MGRLASTEHLRDLARLRRVRDRIDREYACPLDVEALARGAHMSAGHFSREFQAAYGESPYSYLMTRPTGLAWTVSATARPELERLARDRDDGSPTRFLLREANVSSFGRKLVESFRRPLTPTDANMAPDLRFPSSRGRDLNP